jgi:hypothetical protein
MSSSHSEYIGPPAIKILSSFGNKTCYHTWKIISLINHQSLQQRNHQVVGIRSGGVSCMQAHNHTYAWAGGQWRSDRSMHACSARRTERRMDGRWLDRAINACQVQVNSGGAGRACMTRRECRARYVLRRRQGSDPPSPPARTCTKISCLPDYLREWRSV